MGALRMDAGGSAVVAASVLGSGPLVTDGWAAQAPLLAGLLRSSTLTLLYGEAGCGKSALVRGAVWPLLQRRAVDRLVANVPAAAIERRSGPRAEVALWFDDWTGDPLQRLRAALAAALPGLAQADTTDPQRLGRHAQALATQPLLILDGFEQALAPGADRERLDPFIDALVAWVTHPQAPLHVLLVLRDEARLWLAPLRRRIPGLDRHWLRVAAASRPSAAAPAAAAPSSPAPLPIDTGAAPTRSAQASPQPRTDAAAVQPRWNARVAATAAAAVLIAAFGAIGLSRVAQPRSVAPAIPAAADTPQPTTIVAFDSDNSSERRIAADLARALGPHTVPGLRIAAYDLLAIERATAGAGGVAAQQVLMPLFPQEIRLLVRADSPLRFVHEIEGRTMNVGPFSGSRAVTAVSLHRRMFGSLPPEAQLDVSDRDSGLARLLIGAVDVLVLVDAEPSAWLDGLAPDVAGRIRPLTLEASHPASRLALRHYLPAQARSAAGARAEPTLSVMSFLVAPAAADTQAVGAAAGALCAALPDLKRDGHPKWRELQPGLELPSAWPQAPAAAEAMRACGAS
jgi:hypothetical protein